MSKEKMDKGEQAFFSFYLGIPFLIIVIILLVYALPALISSVSIP